MRSFNIKSIVIVSTLLLMISCSETPEQPTDETEIQNPSELSTDNTDIIESNEPNNNIDLSHYESMRNKYIIPGDEILFRVHRTQTDEPVSATGLNFKNGYDFVLKEVRAWDSRIRYLGYKKGNFYLLEVVDTDEKKDRNVSYLELHEKGCIEDIPIYLSLNTQGIDKKYYIKDCDGYEDIDIWITSKEELDSGAIKTKIIIVPAGENFLAYHPDRIISEITVDSEGLFYLWENRETAKRIDSSTLLKKNYELYEIYQKQIESE